MDGKKGQMGTFLIVIAAALLLSLLVLFGSSEFKLPGLNLNFPVLPRELLIQDDVGLVGGESASGFRHVFLGGFSLNSVRERAPVASEDGPVEIVRGILTGQEHELFFGYDGSVPLVFSFKVDEMNGLGLLLLRLNGHLIWTGSPQAGKTVEVPLSNYTAFLSGGGKNSLQFSATSSGWKIWSPSYYMISGLAVREILADSPSYSLPFRLSRDEVLSFTLGRVAFTLVSAAPDGVGLSIMINNATIWEGSPAVGPLPVVVDFSDIVTRVSEDNSITFRLSGSAGSMEIANAETIIFTSTSGKGIPTSSFNVGRDEISSLRSGKGRMAVEFEVSDISAPGDLQVSIIGDHEAIIYDGPALAGKVRLYIQDGQVVFGQNTLVFRSTGSGVFRVKGLSVRMEGA